MYETIKFICFGSIAAHVDFPFSSHLYHVSDFFELFLETKQRSMIYLEDGPDRLRKLLLPRSRAYHKAYLTPLPCARLLRLMVLWKNLPKVMRSREGISEIQHILSRLQGTQTPTTIAFARRITQVFSVSLGCTHIQRPQHKGRRTLCLDLLGRRAHWPSRNHPSESGIRAYITYNSTRKGPLG